MAGEGLETGCYEHGNKLSGYIQDGENF